MTRAIQPDPSADETQPLPSASGGHVTVIGVRRSIAPLITSLRAASVQIDSVPATIPPEQLFTLLSQQRVDLAVMIMSDRTARLFAHLRARQCPVVRVVLIESILHDAAHTYADFVFSLDAPALASNLLSLIRMNRHTSLTLPPAHNPTSTTEIDLLRDTIVKTVSHELRTPLLQIKSAVAMLGESTNERERLMGYALGAISRLENVISNISRLAESLSIRIEITTASDILLQTLRLVRRNWESREQSDRIQTRVAPDLPQILCDRIAISVALQLLLDNALKFSADAVILDIRLSPHGLVEFRVIDRGIGIAPALRDRIFEPFFQADQQDSRKYGGAGVGLAIVRLILERHQTAIHIESRVGEGSTFMFSLPRVPPNTLPD